MLKEDWLLTPIEQTFRLIVLFFFGKKMRKKWKKKSPVVCSHTTLFPYLNALFGIIKENKRKERLTDRAIAETN